MNAFRTTFIHAKIAFFIGIHISSLCTLLTASEHEARISELARANKKSVITLAHHALRLFLMSQFFKESSRSELYLLRTHFTFQDTSTVATHLARVISCALLDEQLRSSYTPGKALLRTVELGNLRLLKILLADSNIDKDAFYCSKQSACRYGCCYGLSTLPRTCHTFCRTLLQKSIKKRQPHITQFLLAQGCDVHKTSLDNRPPLYYSLEAGNPQAFKLLVESGANPRIGPYGQTNILSFALSPHILHSCATVNLILKYFPYLINEPDREGTSPLLQACLYAAHAQSEYDKNSYGRIIDCLILHGANPYQSNIVGLKPALFQHAHSALLPKPDREEFKHILPYV